MFCNPIVDRYSPVGYSIMLHAHSNLSRHRNSAATLRESRGIVFILGGRDMANEIRKHCPFCKRYKSRTLEQKMGPVHDNRLIIAPAFYVSRVDMFGPFTAICERSQVDREGLGSRL